MDLTPEDIRPPLPTRTTQAGLVPELHTIDEHRDEYEGLPLPSSPALCHGFELIQRTEVKERHITIERYVHLGKGTEVCLIIGSATQRFFCFEFQTPPHDNRGIAHASEHMIFRGSKNYESDEPISDLLSESLATNSNAETGPAYTRFYTCSPNLTDLYLHLDRNLDGALFPRLPLKAFDEEVCRLAVDPDDNYGVEQHEAEQQSAEEPHLNGIVYNEMSGELDPTAAHDRFRFAHLFPDTCHRFEAGGLADQIPDCTLRDIEEFVETYYVPSNMRLVAGLQETDSREEMLARIAAKIELHTGKESKVIPETQEPFEKPKRRNCYYPGGETEDSARDTIISLNWAIDPQRCEGSALKLQLLTSLLLEHEDSVLKSALVESGFGEDVLKENLSEDCIQRIFTLGLSGCDASQAGDVEKLILEKLQELVDNGIPPAQIARTLKEMDFLLREESRSPEFAEKAMDYALNAWRHTGNPIAGFEYAASLDEVRSAVAAGVPFFENMIRDLLLDNGHRVTLVLRPDRSLALDLEKTEAERVSALLAAGVIPQRIPHEVKSVPTPINARLKIGDLPRTAPRPALIEAAPGIFYSEQDLDRTSCFKLGLSLRGLPLELLPYVPIIYETLLNPDGKETPDFCGSLSATMEVSATANSDDVQAHLFINGKCDTEDSERLLTKALQGLQSPIPATKKQLLRQLLERRASLESEAHAEPIEFADRRASAKLLNSEAVWEQLNGVSQLLFLREIIPEFRRNSSRLTENLERAWACIRASADPVACYCGDATGIQRVVPNLKAAVDALRRTGSDSPPEWRTPLSAENEGLTIPSKVLHITKVFNLREAGFAHHGSALVLINLLQHGYLWPRIRREKGAYTPGIAYDHLSGLLYLSGNNAPALGPFLSVLAEAPDWLHGIASKVTGLRRCKIGAIGALDTEMSIEDMVYEEFADRLSGTEPGYRAREREEVFSTGAEHCHIFADAMKAASLRPSPVVALASRSILERENRRRGSDPLNIMRFE